MVKKTKCLWILIVAVSGLMAAQSSPAPNADVSFVAKFQMPRKADLNCAGFLAGSRLPDSRFVGGSIETPATTRFAK
jgi:hypothetical protein